MPIEIRVTSNECALDRNCELLSNNLLNLFNIVLCMTMASLSNTSIENGMLIMGIKQIFCYNVICAT